MTRCVTSAILPNDTSEAVAVPGWNCSRVVLLHPSQWRCYSNSRCHLQDDFDALVRALRINGVLVVVLAAEHDPLDIWIRDWGPVGNVHFAYRPAYSASLHSPKAVRTARHKLSTVLRRQNRDVPLVLEGGNVVHNGTVAVVTDKVFRDNPHLSRGELSRRSVRQVSSASSSFLLSPGTSLATPTALFGSCAAMCSC